MAARETVTTRFMTTVAAAGTKYRIKVRQREGAPVLDTLANVCTFRAMLHARSNLLASDTTVFTAADTMMDLEGTLRNIFDWVTLLESIASTSTMLFRFNVAAFAGLEWKSVKLRLSIYEDDTEGLPITNPTLHRCLKPAVVEQATSKYYDLSNLLEWDLIDALAPTDRDETTTVAWTGFPEGVLSTGDMAFSPDLTQIVNDAIALDGGTLLLFVHPVFGMSQYKFWSIRGASDERRPALVFDAY